MRQLTSVLMAAMLVVSAFAAVPAVAMAQETTTATPDGETETATPDGETETATPDGETETETADDDSNETDEDEADANATDPGAQLAGVVGVREAELDGELQSRTFGLRVAQAASDGAKADIVGEQLNDSEERLQELQERKETLEEARENGSMSEGEYRAKIARLHAETKNVERLTNETNETASQLPVETLNERGINATRITMLSERASELSGAEVAEIARGIAGQNAGEQARPEQASGGNAGTEDRPGNATDRDGQDSDADTPDDSDRDAPPNETSDGSDSSTEQSPDGTDASGSGSSAGGSDGSGSGGSDEAGGYGGGQ
jgi:hypothetical protein